MLPIDLHFEEFIEIPVEANVDHLGVVGPEIRIGNPASEDLPAQAELAVASGKLERSQAEVTVA